MADPKFHIVYPNGDKDKLKVEEGVFTELFHPPASRRGFPDYSAAARYARELAHVHNLEFQPDPNQVEYLD